MNEASEYGIKLTSLKLVGGDYKNINEKVNKNSQMFNNNPGGEINKPDNKPGDLTSSKYNISNGYISKISPGLGIQELKRNLNSSGTLEIKDKDGNSVLDTSECATGMTISYGGKTYTLVVTGDIDGNARISTNDLAKLKLNYIGKERLTGAYKEAADIDGNGKITLNDIAKLKLVIIGKEKI